MIMALQHIMVESTVGILLSFWFGNSESDSFRWTNNIQILGSIVREADKYFDARVIYSASHLFLYSVESMHSFEEVKFSHKFSLEILRFILLGLWVIIINILR